MPEIRPPPLTGTRTSPTCGQSAAISRPTVPCPAMTARSSKGGISTYPCSGHELLGGGDPGRQGRLHRHELGAVVLDRIGLDLRRGPRHHHDRAHAEPGRGVGHRVTVVAAGVSNDSVLPGRLLAGRDGGIGAAQLERPGGLQRLGLDQKRRLEPGHREQRRPDRHLLEPAGRVPYLGQADQPGPGPGSGSGSGQAAVHLLASRTRSPPKLLGHNA